MKKLILYISAITLTFYSNAQVFSTEEVNDSESKSEMGAGSANMKFDGVSVAKKDMTPEQLAEYKMIQLKAFEEFMAMESRSYISLIIGSSGGLEIGKSNIKGTKIGFGLNVSSPISSSTTYTAGLTLGQQDAGGLLQDANKPVLIINHLQAVDFVDFGITLSYMIYPRLEAGISYTLLTVQPEESNYIAFDSTLTTATPSIVYSSTIVSFSGDEPEAYSSVQMGDIAEGLYQVKPQKLEAILKYQLNKSVYLGLRMKFKFYDKKDLYNTYLFDNYTINYPDEALQLTSGSNYNSSLINVVDGQEVYSVWNHSFDLSPAYAPKTIQVEPQISLGFRF
jgi:hypothetical protein